MIATAALAGRSLTEAGLSCSGYCKATSSVLDDGGARAGQQLARKSWLAFRARIAAQGQRHYSICFA